MPKAVWRTPSTRRTLAGFQIDSFLTSAWRQWMDQAISPAMVSCDLEAEPLALKSVTVRKLKPRDYSGALEIHLADSVFKLRLNAEGCRRQVYTPRRNSKHLAPLTFWKPIRVLLNGRAGWYSGQFYYLQDYHVVLCNESMPSSLPAPDLIDLQADLI